MTERIRILHCLSSIASGGVERRRLTLARLLDSARYEQRIVARATQGEVVAALQDAGMPVSVVGQGRLFDPGALLRSVRLAREFRPHIVHGAVFEGLSLAVVAGRACGARIVIEETSQATNRSFKGHALFRALVQASHACVAISPAVRDHLLSTTGVPADKITLITNGAASPLLSTPAAAAELRAQLGIGANAFVFGTVARLQTDELKRVSDLIKALALMLQSVDDCHLVVVGDGVERPELEALAQSLGVRAQVTFTGVREDVGNFYAIMDTFSLVSSREGFGLVIVEAMFCSLPVVGSNIGGIRNIVVEGETGLLVPVGEPAAIAAAMLGLRDDPSKRTRLGQAGRLRAEKHFSAERYAADVDAFYTRLLAAR